MLFIPDRVFAFFSPHDLVAGRDLSGAGVFGLYRDVFLS
jgi:hypothetical protein